MTNLDDTIQDELDNTSDEEEETFQHKGAPLTKKDAGFRKFMVDSGVAESVVKLLVSLQQHKATTGEFLPLTKHAVTGVHDLLYDYYDSGPDPIWDNIVEYWKGNAKLSVHNDMLAEDISKYEVDIAETTKKVKVLRAWNNLSNVAGLDASSGAEIEKKDMITGKEFLTRLIGAYKKLPSPDIVEIPEVKKSIFTEKMLANYEELEEFITDAGGEKLMNAAAAGPLFATPGDPEVIKICARLTKLIGELE